MMILQAIVTKYLPYTNTKASRVKATASAGSLTLQWDDALGVDGNHAAAAEALATKLSWEGRWYAGGMPEGNGNVFVCASIAGLSAPEKSYAAFVVSKNPEVK
jgi:hypothetical protein